MSRHRLPVAVVGGGSAGISAVAALASSGTRHVVWYDIPQHHSHKAFAVGELQAYRSVPANTKVDKLLGPGCFGHHLLAPWIAASEPAQAALQQLREQAEPIPELEPYDPSPDGWVGLDPCRAVYAHIGEALAASEHVTCITARVAQVHYVSGSSAPRSSCDASADGLWTVCTEEEQFPEMQVSALVLATGGTPRRVSLPLFSPAPSESDLPSGTAGHVVEIPLRTALDPEQLSRALRSEAPGAAGEGEGKDVCVAVIGNSHTGVVILDLCRSIGVKVYLIGRRPIRHAEWVPEDSDYRYTMSGLKGKGSAVGRWLDGQGQSQTLTAATDEELQGCLLAIGCTHVVQAVGFCATPLPKLTIDGTPVSWSAEALVRQPETSQLQLPYGNGVGITAEDGATVQLQRVYGLGLCFPEDEGYCKPSPDERPTGFSFANNCAARLVTDLDRIDTGNQGTASAPTL
jgi:hypothetical protein